MEVMQQVQYIESDRPREAGIRFGLCRRVFCFDEKSVRRFCRFTFFHFSPILDRDRPVFRDAASRVFRASCRARLT